MKFFAMLLPIAFGFGLSIPNLSAHPQVTCYYVYSKASCRGCPPKPGSKRTLVCRNVVHLHGKRYE